MVRNQSAFKAIIFLVGVCAVGPAGWVAAQEAGTSVRSYSLSDRGVFVVDIGPSGLSDLSVAYGRLQPDAGSVTAPAIEIFGFKGSDGAVINEIGIFASRPIRSGRIHAPFAPTLNTAVAFLNPNESEVRVDFYFSNPITDELEFNAGFFMLGPGEQMSAFITDAPFSITEVGSLETLTFTATLPVAVAAVRELRPVESVQPLYSVLPVGDLDNLTTGTIYLPVFISGAGWATDIVLVNPTDETLEGTFGFISQGAVAPDVDPADIEPNPVEPYLSNPGVTPGRTIAIPVLGLAGPVYSYQIKPRAALVLQTTDIFSPFATQGSIRVVPDADSPAPAAQAVMTAFAQTSNALALGEVLLGVIPPAGLTKVARTYVEASGPAGGLDSISTGVAVANIGGPEIFNDTVVHFELSDLEGNFMASADRVVPSSGQQSFSLFELFPEVDLASGFRGTLRAETTLPDTVIVMTAVRIRTNSAGRSMLTPMVVVNEEEAPSTDETFLPHIIYGPGAFAEIVVFSGMGATDGFISLFGADGVPANILAD